ncbi:MAG: NAD(P)H-dependent oxidoreductase subunit E [Nitrospirota bacterium]|nr:MAG: NAD(P)H-dependent oxidoreductase subunit E [Nitrospirota bacterium]
MDAQVLDRILDKYAYRHSDIIEIMQDVQRIENYLPMESLSYISERLELNLARIYDIATFYKAFSLKPRGKHVIKVCCGTACHLSGASQSLDQITRQLGIEEGETTEDRMFSLETVNCLGACALAPVVVIGAEYHDSADANKIDKLLSGYKVNGESTD